MWSRRAGDREKPALERGLDAGKIARQRSESIGAE